MNRSILRIVKRLLKSLKLSLERNNITCYSQIKQIYFTNIFFIFKCG